MVLMNARFPLGFRASPGDFPSCLGRIPTKEEYMADVGVIAASGAETYRYMDFDQIEEYQDVAKTVAA